MLNAPGEIRTHNVSVYETDSLPQVGRVQLEAKRLNREAPMGFEPTTPCTSNTVLYPLSYGATIHKTRRSRTANKTVRLHV